MKLIDLQKIADKGYNGKACEGKSEFYNEKTGMPTKTSRGGDTLQWFVHIEIAETFDATASDSDQISEAIRVIEAAIVDLQGVRIELQKKRG